MKKTYKSEQVPEIDQVEKDRKIDIQPLNVEFKPLVYQKKGDSNKKSSGIFTFIVQFTVDSMPLTHVDLTIVSYRVQQSLLNGFNIRTDRYKILPVWFEDVKSLSNVEGIKYDIQEVIIKFETNISSENVVKIN